MLKKITFALLILLPVLAFSQGSFNIKGNFTDGRSKGRVYATYTINGRALTDSADVKEGRFGLLSAEVSEFPVMVILSYSKDKVGKFSASNQTLILHVDQEGINMAISGDFRNPAVSGSKLYAEMQHYVDFIKVPGEELGMIPVNGVISLGSLKTGSILEEGQNSQQKVLQGEERKIDSLNKVKIAMEKIANDDRNNRLEVRKMLQMKYIQNFPDSYFSFIALREIAGPYMNLAEIEPLFNSLSERLRNSSRGREFAARIEAEKRNPSKRVDIGAEMRKAIVQAKSGPKSKFGIGSLAPEFTLQDAASKDVKLSDFKGKYVLIDFWASWCIPCRRENPNVLQAYKKYKKKGFDVLGVALEREQDREKWLKAIKEDKLAWTQVTDFKIFEAPIVKLYGIEAIPQNYLIDPSGKIIAVNLRGEALDEKLAEIFNN